MLDIGYKLDLSYSTADRTESFSTTFTLPSDTLRYTLNYLHRLPRESKITFVSLTKYRICHQKLRYLSKLNLSIDNPPETIPTLPPTLENSTPTLENSTPTLEISTPILENSTPILGTLVPVVGNSGFPNTDHPHPTEPQDPDDVKKLENKFSFEYDSLIYPPVILLVFVCASAALIIGILSCVFVCCWKRKKDRVGDRAPGVEGRAAPPEADVPDMLEMDVPDILVHPNPIEDNP